MNSDKFLKEVYGLRETIKEAFNKTASENDLNWWTNREKELKQWKKIIEEATKINKNFIVFIIGSYGRGKTISLLKIVKEAKNFSEEIYPVYLSFKGEEKSKPGLDFIFRIFRSIDFYELIKNKKIDEIRRSIDNIPVYFNEAKIILKNIYYDRLQKQQTLVKASSNLNKEKALYFIRGEIKSIPIELRKLGIIRKIDNIDVAKQYLIAILYFIKNLGYKALLLSIDEFEYLFSLVSKSMHSIYLALLRGLYDIPVGWGNLTHDEIANLVFFIAISEDGWERLIEIEKKEKSQGGPVRPLMRRIDLKTTLRNFNKKETEELIIKVLSYNRIKKKFHDNPLIPFTEDFVEYIHEITKGNPSNIKEICAHVLDKGLEERVAKLTKEYAQKVVKERNL